MGAGDGKSRRVQTANVYPRLQPEWNPEQWWEFLSRSKLGDVNVHKYYLGSEPLGPGRNTDEDASRVASELLRYMVAVGVIVLPGRYEADDFVFRVYGEDRVPATMIVSRKDNPGKQFEFMNMEDFVNSSNRMAGSPILDDMER